MRFLGRLTHVFNLPAPLGPVQCGRAQSRQELLERCFCPACCPLSAVSIYCPLTTVSCLLSPVYLPICSLLSPVPCPLPAIPCSLRAVACLLSPACHPLSAFPVSCSLSTVLCHLLSAVAPEGWGLPEDHDLGVVSPGATLPEMIRASVPPWS